MNKKDKYRRPDHCLNCNHPLDAHTHYCPSCGQKALPDHLTLKYFIHEFLSNYFSFDSKFFNTVKQLIIKPGFLSNEFIAGRRIRYINPIQLFVFTSFLYFLINSFMFLKEDVKKDLVRINDENNKNIVSDSLDIQQLDSLIIIHDGETSDTIEHSLSGEFVKKGNDFNKLDRATQNERISNNMSYAVFLLLPVFAFYLGFIFRRKEMHYLQNIIFSLHFHSFFFVVGFVLLFFDRLLTGDIDSFILNLSAVIYLLIATKRFYKFSWILTTFRLLGLILIYGLTVIIFLLASILISVLF